MCLYLALKAADHAWVPYAEAVVRTEQRLHGAVGLDSPVGVPPGRQQHSAAVEVELPGHQRAEALSDQHGGHGTS